MLTGMLLHQIETTFPVDMAMRLWTAWICFGDVDHLMVPFQNINDLYLIDAAGIMRLPAGSRIKRGLRQLGFPKPLCILPTGEDFRCKFLEVGLIIIKFSLNHFIHLILFSSIITTATEKRKSNRKNLI